MKKSLPRQISVELDPVEFGPGLVGMVQAVAAAMDHQGEEADVDELLCISSAAFCNYVFDPEYNQHEEEPREFSVLAEYFSNYGPWESISYATGMEILEVTSLPPVEILKVAAFELASGRPFVTLNADLEPDLVVSYEIAGDRRQMSTVGGVDFDLAGEAVSLQGESEVFDNWLVLVRPGERAEWAASMDRQRINVLRWAVEHGFNHREFFQETRENYVPGLRGLDRFRDFLRGLTDPDGVEYAEAYLERLRQARTAASSVLPRWASSIGEVLESADVAAEIEAAARHYGEVATRLADYDTMVDAMAEVVECEERALGALRRAAQRFPQAFEAI